MPADGVFSGPITATFTANRCDESPFTGQCEREDKKAYGFQISHFYGSFRSDMMALKGLMGTRGPAASRVLSKAMELKVKVIAMVEMAVIIMKIMVHFNKNKQNTKQKNNGSFK